MGLSQTILHVARDLYVLNGQVKGNIRIYSILVVINLKIIGGHEGPDTSRGRHNSSAFSCIAFKIYEL